MLNKTACAVVNDLEVDHRYRGNTFQRGAQDQKGYAAQQQKIQTIPTRSCHTHVHQPSLHPEGFYRLNLFRLTANSARAAQCTPASHERRADNPDRERKRRQHHSRVRNQK